MSRVFYSVAVKPTLPFVSAGAINPGDPVLIGAAGTVTAVADDGEAIAGWSSDAATALGAERVQVKPADDDAYWVLPPCGTVTGDLTTTTGQAAAGASASSPGTTLLALIGASYALDLTSAVYRIDLSDTTPAANLPLQLVGFVYNLATQLWECITQVRPACRQLSAAVVV